MEPRPGAVADVEVDTPPVGAEDRMRMADAPGAGAVGIVELRQGHILAHGGLADDDGPRAFRAVPWSPVRQNVGGEQVAVWAKRRMAAGEAMRARQQMRLAGV